MFRDTVRASTTYIFMLQNKLTGEQENVCDVISKFFHLEGPDLLSLSSDIGARDRINGYFCCLMWQ